MPNRYFAQTAISGDSAELVGPEAHHLTHVMRAKRGDRILLFDGSGAEFPAEIEAITRSGVRLAVLGRRPVDRELPVQLTMGVALPKGDRQKWLVEKAVELGVSKLVPLATSRSVARPSARSITRLERLVIEASKQCGRNRLMTIDRPDAWDRFVQVWGDVPLRLVAHPGEAAPAAKALPVGIGKLQSVVVAVGPEGGFTDDEVALATAWGWRPIHLGPRILRVETAAIYLAALVPTSWQSSS